MNHDRINEDLDRVARFLLEFAQLILNEQAGFFPFGAGMTADGEMTDLGTDPENARPSVIVSRIHTALVRQAAAGEIVASGICTDVEITLPGTTERWSAICIELEHLSGYAFELFVPYVFHAPGEVQYLDEFTAPGEAVIFVPVAG
jgi:hypothetical protein